MNKASITSRLSLPLLVCSAVLASAGTATAQSAIHTSIVGYKTETIRGGDAVTFMGIELLAAPAYDGVISAVGEDTLELTGVDLSEVLDPLGHYFVDVVHAQNGAAIGANTAVLHWSGNTLTLGDDLSDLLTAGVDRIRIHLLPTVGEIFGEGGDVLNGGTLNTADIIYLPNPNGKETIALYYSNSPLLGKGWRKVGDGADQSDMPVYFTDGIYIHKRSPGDVQLRFAGEVKATPARVVVEEGFVPYSAVFPGGSTLGNSGLYNPDSPQHSLRAGTASTADSVLIDTDGDGIAEMYYYSAGGLVGRGWRKVGNGADQSSTPLNSAFGIINRGSAMTLLREPGF